MSRLVVAGQTRAVVFREQEMRRSFIQLAERVMRDAAGRPARIDTSRHAEDHPATPDAYVHPGLEAAWRIYAVLQPWREAVLNECAVTYLPFFEKAPQTTLSNIVDWHVVTALDPAVSERAAKLQSEARRQAFADVLAMMTLGTTPEALQDYCIGQHEAVK